MKSKRRLTGNILILTGLVMLLCAGGLFFFNMRENNSFDEEAGGLADRVKTQIESGVSPDATEASSQDPDEEPAQVPDDVLKVKYVDGAAIDGILSIPAIKLEMAVYDKWNDELLRRSVCRYYGSPSTDDFVIAGHNYRRGFGKLKKLKAGDEVFFTDMDGNVTRYEVKQIEVLNGTDVSGMLSGGWHLSLYTCTYGGSARLTVRCKKA